MRNCSYLGLWCRYLHEILPQLPGSFSLPIMIVQHRMHSKDTYLTDSLNRKCKLEVKEAEDKEIVQEGRVYLAPAGYHMLVEKDGTFSLSIDDLVSYARPSIDVLFQSAARAYQERLVGVILTGANSDGSEGIMAIKQYGGITIAQDPDSAASRAMPDAAIATGHVDFILKLKDLVNFLVNIVE